MLQVCELYIFNFFRIFTVYIIITNYFSAQCNAQYMLHKQITTLTKIDTMFFVRLWMTNARFQTRCCMYMCKKAAQCPRRDACTLWHAKIPWLQLQNESAAKKMPSRDSKLALGRLAHSLASNLQISLWCHQSSVMEAQLLECRRRAAIKGALEQRTPPLAGFSASIVISMLLLHITVVYI